MNAPKLHEPKHVDDFVDNDFTQHNYARWFFFLKRLAAVYQNDWREWISQYQLFCTYKGARYRVTGASRLGDIWLHSDFTRDTGYEHRVSVEECSDWSRFPTSEAVSPAHSRLISAGDALVKMLNSAMVYAEPSPSTLSQKRMVVAEFNAAAEEAQARNGVWVFERRELLEGSDTFSWEPRWADFKPNDSEDIRNVRYAFTATADEGPELVPLKVEDPAIAAIKFAASNHLEASTFLECWLHGEWDTIRKEWPDAPESIYVKE